MEPFQTEQPQLKNGLEDLNKNSLDSKKLSPAASDPREYIENSLSNIKVSKNCEQI